MKIRVLKRSYIICIISIIAILLFSINSYAAGSFTVSTTSSTIKVGETTSITVTAKDCGGKFSFTSSDSTIVSVNKTEEWIENGNYTINLTAKKAGNATITITAIDVADSSTPPIEVKGTKIINVTVKEDTPPAEPNFTTVNQTVYAKGETNIRESYSTSSKSYGMLPAGESINRIGIGDNGWSKVQYNGKTAYIYSNNLTTTKPEETKSTDKSLKTLTVTEGTLTPEFTPETTKYSIDVPNTLDKVSIDAVANHEKATVAITGNENLVSGSNMVKIIVTAEDGTTRIYNLEVIKKEKDPIQLTKLSIPGITIEPEFKPDTYKYNIKLDIKSTVTDFAIQAEANESDATVEIIGNSNFQPGENVITILVTSKDGKDKISYQIIVNKIEINETNIFSGENGKTNIALIIIGALIIIAIIIVVFAIIRKRRAQEYMESDEVNPYKQSFNEDEEDLDISEETNKEDFTGVYKNHIMEQDEMEQNTGKFDTSTFENEEYIPDNKKEENNEMTRRFSTNYDYTLETYKKNKNPGASGKGKHF